MWYDLIILGILGFATFRGAVKGIVWQLATIAALVLCFACAETFSLLVAPLISVKPPLNRWIAMFVLYMFFSFLSFAAARQLREVIERARFVEYDRHMGALFGFLKGALFTLVMTFFVVTLSESARSHVMESRTGHVAAIVMDRLHPVMPDELHDILEPYIHQLDQPGMDLHHSPHHHSHQHHGTGTGSSDDSSQSPSSPQQPNEQQSQTDRPADSSESLLEIVLGLPGLFDPELQELILEALRNTSPENREELVEKLRTGVPGMMRTIAREWRDGKPAPEDVPELSQSELLLRDIAAIYTEYPDAQEAIREEVQFLLSGLPDQVVLSVLQDWYADLFGIVPDPDPETSFLTSLDDRILRQLAFARISLSSLNTALQDRLRESLPR